MRPPAHRLRAVLCVALALALVGCGSDGGDDPDDAGPAARAVEQLEAFGLTRAQASCVVDEVGADTVVEAGDLTALAESQVYRDAIEACIDGD